MPSSPEEAMRNGFGFERFFGEKLFEQLSALDGLRRERVKRVNMAADF